MQTCQSTSTTPKARVGIRLVLAALFLLALDQIVKFLVYRYIPLINHARYHYPYGGIGIFQDFGGVEFSINHMTNTGAAWGFFGNYQSLLVALRICLIFSALVYVFFFNKQRSWQIPILMIISGAIGNVIDFYLYGHVIDMFHFILWGYDFPVFNIADSAICLGIGSLFILSWFE